MKKIILSIITLSLIISGCKTLPEQEKVAKTSFLVGRTTSYVVTQLNIDEDVKESVVKIMNEIHKIAPDSTYTCESYLKDIHYIAKSHIDNYINSNIILPIQGEYVMNLFDTYIIPSIRFMMTKRVNTYDSLELVHIAAYNFCDGFLSDFNRSSNLMRSSTIYAIDEDTYQFLININN